MADVIGLSDVSSPDTGKGSKLKTGCKMSYNMPCKEVCAKIKDPQERSDCENYRGKYAKKVKSSYKDVLSGASTRDSLKTMKKGLGK